MKNLYILFLTMIAAACCVSCNNEWESEQYEQYVSFKATPNDEGVTPIYMRYNAEGKVTYDLPMIISGSTPNAQTRTVHIGLDLDTLAVMNRERFGERTELYYKVLDPSRYNLPETIEIPAGQSTITLPIDFKLGGLDQSDKWVLPVTILDDPSYDYKANPRKYYRKAILRVNPFNEYSGTYAGTLLKIYMQDDNINALTLAEHKSFTVDDKTLLFYAGSRNVDNLDRKLYKIFVEFTDERVELLTKKLNIYTDNPLIKLKIIGTPTYQIDEMMDPKQTYMKHIYITLTMKYEFVDYTTIPNSEFKYTVDGTLSLQRDLNTLIPDEDQQIQW